MVPLVLTTVILLNGPLLCKICSGSPVVHTNVGSKPSEAYIVFAVSIGTRTSLKRAKATYRHSRTGAQRRDGGNIVGNEKWLIAQDAAVSVGQDCRQNRQSGVLTVIGGMEERRKWGSNETWRISCVRRDSFYNAADHNNARQSILVSYKNTLQLGCGEYWCSFGLILEQHNNEVITILKQSTQYGTLSININSVTVDKVYYYDTEKRNLSVSCDFRRSYRYRYRQYFRSIKILRNGKSISSKLESSTYTTKANSNIGLNHDLKNISCNVVSLTSRTVHICPRINEIHITNDSRLAFKNKNHTLFIENKPLLITCKLGAQGAATAKLCITSKRRRPYCITGSNRFGRDECQYTHLSMHHPIQRGKNIVTCSGEHTKPLATLVVTGGARLEHPVTSVDNVVSVHQCNNRSKPCVIHRDMVIRLRCAATTPFPGPSTVRLVVDGRKMQRTLLIQHNESMLLSGSIPFSAQPIAEVHCEVYDHAFNVTTASTSVYFSTMCPIVACTSTSMPSTSTTTMRSTKLENTTTPTALLNATVVMRPLAAATSNGECQCATQLYVAVIVLLAVALLALLAWQNRKLCVGGYADCDNRISRLSTKRAWASQESVGNETLASSC